MMNFNSRNGLIDSFDDENKYYPKLSDQQFIEEKDISYYFHGYGDDILLSPLIINGQEDSYSENSLEFVNDLKLENHNSEENNSKKKTCVSGSNNNSSKNDDQKPEEKNDIKILSKNSEKYSIVTEIKKENNPQISSNNYKFISHVEIMQKYGNNFKDLNLTGEGENTKNIEKNLKKEEKSKNSEKNENLLSKKRKKEEKIDEKIIKNIEIIKRGRKKNEDNSGVGGVHTKMKEDNLMYTIKSNYNNWLLKVINIFLPDNQKLMKINFKEFSKIINTNENKKYLEMELSEIFSKNISDIYSKVQEKHGKNRNETIIQEIMESNNENAKKLLKIKYKDGLDLYRFKENENEGYLKKILGDEILNKIDGRVDELLTKSFERERKKNEIGANDFVSSLLVMIYNYERWFSIKTPRKPRAKKEDKKGDENNENEELDE